MANQVKLEETCTKCKGTGKAGNAPCLHCQGKGTILTETGRKVLNFLRDNIELPKR